MTPRDTWDKVRSIPRLLSGYMDRLPNAVRTPFAPKNNRKVHCRVMEVTVHHDHRVLHGVDGLEVMMATGHVTATIRARDAIDLGIEYEMRTSDPGIVQTLQPGDEIIVDFRDIVSKKLCEYPR